MRSLCSVLILLGLTVPASAQDITSDCFREDLSGPVEHVEITRFRFEAQADRFVEGEPKVIRRELYDDQCNFVGREYVGSLLYNYWYDDAGRGRRFDSKPVPGSTAITFTVPLDRPPVPEAERERGTLRESSYNPGTRVLETTLSQSGRVRQDFRYTLDSESRVVHELMIDSDGMRSYEATSVFSPSGTEEVVDYEYPVTAVRSTPIVSRKMYRFADRDDQGNWTRRTLYRWEDEEWKPNEVYVRSITYRED